MLCMSVSVCVSVYGSVGIYVYVSVYVCMSVCVCLRVFMSGFVGVFVSWDIRGASSMGIYGLSVKPCW